MSAFIMEIFFFIIHCLEGLFKSLIFHDVIFIINIWVREGNSYSGRHTTCPESTINAHVSSIF
jgi:hypothetical protein